MMSLRAHFQSPHTIGRITCLIIQLAPHCHSDTETTINYPQLNTSLFGVYNFVIQPPLIIGYGLYRNLNLIDIVGLIENEASTLSNF